MTHRLLEELERPVKQALPRRSRPARWIFGEPRTLKSRLQTGAISAAGFGIGTLLALSVVHGELFVAAISCLAFALLGLALQPWKPELAYRRPMKGIYRRRRHTPSG